MIIVTIFFSLLIWLEMKLENVFSLPFPRNWADVFNKKHLLLNALVRNYKRCGKGLPPGSNILSLSLLSALNGEPAKNATSRGVELRVLFQQSEEPRKVLLFIKFQSGRDFPLLLQGCRAAVEPGVHREMRFYRDVAPHVPLKVAECYAAEGFTSINRVFLALEYFEGENHIMVNDSEKPDIRFVRLMLKEIAPFHKHYWNRLDAPELQWIPEKQGLDFVNYIKGLRGQMPDWYLSIFNALQSYFKGRRVTLLHGDCRPGNQIFVKNPKKGQHSVIFSDFEALTIGPFLWDFTYCIVLGLDSKTREENFISLLDDYLNELERLGLGPFDRDEANSQVKLLMIVLFYVSELIVSKKYWNGHGNTQADFDAWKERVSNALLWALESNVSDLLGVPEKHITCLHYFSATKFAHYTSE